MEANHVFLFNQWWNPSANDQARDRVVRIGQRRKVRVYRFCCRGTIEETLERILKSKRALFDDAVERLAKSESAVWTRVLSEVGMERLLSESTPGWRTIPRSTSPMDTTLKYKSVVLRAETHRTTSGLRSRLRSADNTSVGCGSETDHC